MENAVASRASICVLESGYSQEFLIKRYPEATLIPKPFEDEVLRGVLDGDCDVAASSVAAFQTYRRSQQLNHDCSLKWEGRVVHSVKGGLAVAVDTGVLCTSLISYVLDFHLMNMKTDGFLENAWNEYLDNVGDNHCQTKQEQEDAIIMSGDDETGRSLTMQDLGGIFILHAILAVVAICVALFQLIFMKAQSPSHLIKKITMHPDDWEEYNSVFKPSLDLTKRTINTLESELVAGALKRQTSFQASTVSGNYRDDMSVASEGSTKSGISVKSTRYARRRQSRDEMSVSSERDPLRRRKRRQRRQSRMIPLLNKSELHDVGLEEQQTTRSLRREPSIGLISFENVADRLDGTSQTGRRTSSGLNSQLESAGHIPLEDYDTSEPWHDELDNELEHSQMMMPGELNDWESSNLIQSSISERDAPFKEHTRSTQATIGNQVRDNSSRFKASGSSNRVFSRRRLVSVRTLDALSETPKESCTIQLEEAQRRRMVGKPGNHLTPYSCGQALDDSDSNLKLLYQGEADSLPPPNGTLEDSRSNDSWGDCHFTRAGNKMSRGERQAIKDDTVLMNSTSELQYDDLANKMKFSGPVFPNPKIPYNEDEPSKPVHRQSRRTSLEKIIKRVQSSVNQGQKAPRKNTMKGGGLTRAPQKLLSVTSIVIPSDGGCDGAWKDDAELVLEVEEGQQVSKK
eukprot:CAMPEP_0202446090 /NCGR_PEP_ID=MMETSP1360-20130828/4723_1 /ASSEMBLY_ACC=CAM_ASM_000848 /TAXON_ID=515479 /ORGANISM="Licmophora paradoxa, Strain CCMP2313" /LENGTH=685 /DNA_ID=CAMNT_0049062521 /DNA_START=180 /DNA_END=2237 /DNA_ORIENTATION=-